MLGEAIFCRHDFVRSPPSTLRGIPEAALRAAVEQAEGLMPEVLRLMDLASRDIALTRPERHLETIRRCLATGYRQQPLVDEDSPPDAIEKWDFGCTSAMNVRPGSWDAIADQAGLAVASVAMLMPQYQLEQGEEDIELLDDGAHPLSSATCRGPSMAYAFWHGLAVQPLIETATRAEGRRSVLLRLGAQIQEVLRRHLTDDQ